MILLACCILLDNNNLKARMGNCQKDEQGEESSIVEGNGPVCSVRISNYIWNKDYQGLFDYDSKSIDKKMIKVIGNAVVLKNHKKFELQDQIPYNNEEKIKNSLFKLVCKPNFYQIHPIFVEGETCMLQKVLWLVVASLPKKQHTIQQRDILKLGKQKVRVREIVLPDMNQSTVTQNPKLTKLVYQNLTQKNQLPKSQLVVDDDQKQSKSVITNSEQVCRICLDPGQYTNPLITPCKCSGSVKYIHLNCLKTWLAKRLNVVKTACCVTINWVALSCEMCKTPFRYRIYMDNKKFYTVDIPKPPKPYIIFELMRKQSNSKGKIFHFVSFAEKTKINLGRRKDIDVKISDDISISRIHASIEYLQSQQKFVLTDNKSKFGTLVLIKRGLICRPQYPGISIQVGAEIYSFDSIRGQNKPNFQFEEGDQEDYFVQDNYEEEQDSQQESQGAESMDNVPVNQNQIEESASPQLRPRASIESQQN